MCTAPLLHPLRNWCRYKTQLIIFSSTLQSYPIYRITESTCRMFFLNRSRAVCPIEIQDCATRHISYVHIWHLFRLRECMLTTVDFNVRISLAQCAHIQMWNIIYRNPRQNFQCKINQQSGVLCSKQTTLFSQWSN